MGSNRYELPLWRLSPSLANINGIIDAGAPTQPARIFSGSAFDVDAVASVNRVSKAHVRKTRVPISVSPSVNHWLRGARLRQQIRNRLLCFLLMAGWLELNRIVMSEADFRE